MRPRAAIQSLRLALLCSLFFSVGSGCFSEVQWVKDEGPASQMHQQLASCMLEAQRTFPASDDSGDSRREKILGWVSLCMKSNGWKQDAVSQ